MSRAESIANALGGAKKTPSGWICKCPCHEDKAASLSLKVSDTGGIVLNCFAGCKWEDIKAEIERRGLLTKDNPPARKEYRDKYAGAKFYIYRDLVGNILCRKVKLPDKKMWFERYEAGKFIPKLDGLVVPLYNLQAVISATGPVYLCEGEKDAETLITRGLVATTNHAGATSWAKHLTDQLTGKTVIIIPDNDEAGRKRVAIISKALQGTVKELRVFVPDGVPEKGDITDWVENGGDSNEILGKSIAIEKKAAKKKATRAEYFELIDSVLGNPRRCIFNEKLMYLDTDTGLWNPAINALDIVRSEALYLNETSETKFDTAYVTPHFAALERSRPREFLIEIPEWDGEKRIEAMAGLVTLNNEQGISDIAFSELLQEWCGLVFQRLFDPMIQNRMLILQGGQGIGKDTWISMLVDGLGQFCIPWASIKEDKDTYLQLHKGLIMKIPEFDKTRNTETSTLKDIVTAPSTDIRAPYDKDSKIRLSRCSFISSTNPRNILRDSTGNRRYLIFELQAISYAYAGWSKAEIKTWQMQCLAEMAHLGAIKYKASPESWREMNIYIEKETPTDYSLDITEQLVSKWRESLSLDLEMSPTDSKLVDLISSVAKTNNLKFKTVKSMVQSRIGTFRRIGDRRFWVWRLPKQVEDVKNTLENTAGVDLNALEPEGNQVKITTSLF